MNKKSSISIILAILGIVEGIANFLLAVLEESRNWAEGWGDHLAGALFLLMVSVPLYALFGIRFLVSLLKTSLEKRFRQP